MFDLGERLKLDLSPLYSYGIRALGAVVSVTIFITGAWLWPRSYEFPQLLTRTSETRYYGLHSASGSLSVYIGGWSKRAGGSRGWELSPTGQFKFDPKASWRFAGFAYGRMWGGSPPNIAFAVPYWFICAVTAAPPLLALLYLRRDLRRRTRIKRGLCPACGYDLRGTAERCPECGMAIPREGTPGC